MASGFHVAVEGQNLFRTTLKPWETVVCWYLRKNRIIPNGFLGAKGFRPSTEGGGHTARSKPTALAGRAEPFPAMPGGVAGRPAEPTGFFRKTVWFWGRTPVFHRHITYLILKLQKEESGFYGPMLLVYSQDLLRQFTVTKQLLRKLHPEKDDCHLVHKAP